MTQIMKVTVRHVTSWVGHTKYQAAWFLLNRVCKKTLVAEGEKLTYIYKHLLRMYSEATTDVGAVHQRERWIEEAEPGGTAHYNKMRSGCTWTAVPRGTTLNADHCIETVRSLNACLCQVHPARKMKCSTSITMLAAHKCVHHRGYHTFWMVSVATSTLQSWPHTIIWACKKQPAGTLWHQWQATAECRAPMSAEGGRATVTGWNTCFYSKLEEDYQLRWRLHCEICPQKCCGEVAMNFTYLTCKQHTIKIGGLTVWLPLIENHCVLLVCSH